MASTDLREHHPPTGDLRAPSDAALVGRVADVVAVPRAATADSFVLHAPLELLARTALLPFVDPPGRERARDRIGEIATGIETFGDPVRVPTVPDLGSVGNAARRLGESVSRGDLDDVDAAASWLAAHARADELPALLADLVLPLLGAAGHAPIFLWLHPRVSPRRELTGALLRPLCRELARRPEWRLHWIDDPRPDCPDSEDSAASLFAALAATPRLGRPSSTFIHPLMSRVDRPELAGSLGALTGGREIDRRARALLRVAAWSMLDEPGDDAPYGWSHCLTMPQAVLGLARACSDPSRALAIAASHVYGFRASLAARALDAAPAARREPADAVPIGHAIDGGVETARAAAWQLPSEQFAALRTTVATIAATHHDAHLAKYVLACLDAAADDPSAERLYLTAAATLCGWWAEQPGGVGIS